MCAAEVSACFAEAFEIINLGRMGNKLENKAFKFAFYAFRLCRPPYKNMKGMDLKMNDNKFTAGLGSTIKAAFKRAFWITFIFSLIMVATVGNVSGVIAAIFWVMLLAGGFWELTHAVTLEVGADGLKVTRGGDSDFYKYAVWYIFYTGKTTIIAENRKLDDREEINCRNFSRSTMLRLSKEIKDRQDEFFVRRAMRDNGEQMTIDELGKRINEAHADAKHLAANRAAPSSSSSSRNDTRSASQRAEAAKRASAEAAARNPYSKRSGDTKPTESKTRTVAETIGSTSTVIKTIDPNGLSPKERGSVDIPEPPSIDKVELTVEAPKPSDLPKVEAVSRIDVTARTIESPGIADLPKTSNWEEFVAKKPKPSTHEHGEDFHKKVFYYPRRDVSERAERRFTLTLLSTLAISTAVFLLLYIAAPRYALAEALMILAGCAAVIGFTAASNRTKLHGMVSKLEVTENHLVLDNTRYRLRELSNKTMTPPEQASGRRFIRFNYEGKTIVCPLGPCEKTKRSSDEYFGRYEELFEALGEKGFRPCL